jgi:hypothetical protein
MPACQSALQPWVSLGLLYNQSPRGIRFLNKIICYRMGLLAPCQNIKYSGILICQNVSPVGFHIIRSKYANILMHGIGIQEINA